MIPARGPQTMFRELLCCALFAMQSMLCYLCCAIFAMLSLLCYLCHAIFAMLSWLCYLCYAIFAVLSLASEPLWSLPKASETPSSPTIVFYSVRSILHAKLMKNIGKHALFDDFERKTLKKLLFFAILHAKLSKNIKNMQELTKLVKITEKTCGFWQFCSELRANEG